MGLKVKGCFCISLRTAGLVLGGLVLLGSILQSIITAIALSRLYSRGASPVTDVISVTDPTKVSDSYEEWLNKKEEYVNSSEEQAEIAFSIFNALVSGIMIFGILKNKHQMLLPWLICNVIGIAFLILAASFFVGFFFMTERSSYIILGTALLGDLAIGLSCWVWVVIFSLYKEIRENTGQVLSIDRNTPVGTTSAPPHQEYENKSYGHAYP